MVKKIKKYLKRVVCCALILSLVAPSYAALSASDGSSFVTKAEFDSALADFNARLTTFEAGINSKIDSQVTSYLDRNGIWNGQSQPLVPGAKISFGLKSSSELRQNLWYMSFSRSDPTGTQGVEHALGIVERYNEDENVKFVDNIVKSGLAYIRFTNNPGSGSTSLKLFVGTDNPEANSPASDHFNFTYLLKLQFLENNTREISSLSYSYIGQAAGANWQMGALNETPLLVFVKKDTSLWVKETESFSYGDGSNWSMALVVYWGGIGKNSFRDFKISSIDIY